MAPYVSEYYIKHSFRYFQILKCTGGLSQPTKNPFRDANPLEGVLNIFLPKAHKILVLGLLKNVNVG